MPYIPFEPERLAVLGRVFNEACAAVRPPHNGTTARATLANFILALASEGQHNPAHLLDGTLAEYREIYKPSSKDEERQPAEMALDEGLQETFPASDAVSAVQPAMPDFVASRKADPAIGETSVPAVEP